MPIGTEIEATEDSASSQPTLAIRPERVLLTDVDAGQFRGVIDQIVYEGIDTTYHLLLPDGSSLRACVQNRDGIRPRLARGDSVGIVLPSDAIRVLTE